MAEPEPMTLSERRKYLRLLQPRTCPPAAGSAARGQRASCLTPLSEVRPAPLGVAACGVGDGVLPPLPLRALWCSVGICVQGEGQGVGVRSRPRAMAAATAGVGCSTWT
jgi:hypothetical protein